MLTIKLSKALERVFAFSTGARVRRVPVIFDVDNAAVYAAAEVITLAQELPNAVQHAGGSAYLTDIQIFDGDDQNVALDIYLTSSNKNMGTVNAAISITDRDALDVLGKVPIASGDYSDFIASRFVNKVMGDSGLPLTVHAEPGSRSVFVSLVNGVGTPTFTDGGLRGVFTFQDVVRAG